MWTDPWSELIRAIHQAGHPTVIVVTGGGASAISELLAVPGASRTILEARVPYAQEALWEWLGRKPDQACDEQTALAMASVACQRGQYLLEKQSQSSSGSLQSHPQTTDGELRQPIGLSCTASLASDRPKRGDHRLFVAVQTPRQTVSGSLTLNKGVRSRQEEETLTSQILVRLLAKAEGIETGSDVSLLPGEEIKWNRLQADPELAAVWKAQAPLLWSDPDGAYTHQPPFEVRGVLCGAFDPLHRGHEELRHVAEKLLGGPVAYEMSITNVDKPPLDFLTIDRRRKQFTETPLVLTNAPRYLNKAAVLPGMTFVIGSDTAERLLNAKYDGGTQQALNHVLEEIRTAGCRFLVACRNVRGIPLALSDLPVPDQFRDLFREIPENEFRVDLSSTEVRQAMKSATAE